MGCASSSIIGDRKDKKKKKEAALVSQRSVHDRWPTVRTNSARTGLAEPALSQKEGESHRGGRLGGSLDNFTVGTNDMATKEDAALDESPPSGDAVLKTSPPSSSVAAGVVQSASDDDLPRTSNGFIVRNGVYYSESELAEESIQWQPKYWTPDRIGKWVEDTEFPESIRFHEVRKTILQSSTKKDYRLPEISRKMHDSPSSAAEVG